MYITVKCKLYKKATSSVSYVKWLVVYMICVRAFIWCLLGVASGGVRAASLRCVLQSTIGHQYNYIRFIYCHGIDLSFEIIPVVSVLKVL